MIEIRDMNCFRRVSRSMPVGVILAFLAQIAAAQQVDPRAYFPIDIGNRWEFGYVLEPPDMPPDTVSSGKFEILDTLSIEGREYFRITGLYAGIDTLRSDIAGRIWRRAAGRDDLFFDFTAPDDSMYLYPFGTGANEDSVFYEVHVRHFLSIKTLAGDFENAVSFGFDIPEYIDEEIGFTFAPNIGPVQIGGAWNYGVLYAAKIGDREIIAGVTRGSSQPEITIEAHLFPNPIRGNGWLRVESKDAGLIEVTVFDLLGRKVKALPSTFLEAGVNLIKIDAGELAKSVYHVRIQNRYNVMWTSMILR